MAKGRKRKKDIPAMDVIRPTPEQMAKGAFEETWQISDGHRARAFRRVPVIVTMANAGRLSQRQFNALARYRDVALACDRSPLPDSVGRMGEIRGHTDGTGLPPSLLRSWIELGVLERALGSLRDVAYAIAVGDSSPEEWAISKFGSTMQTKEIRRKVIKWFAPPRAGLQSVILDVQMAGERLAAEIGF